VDFPPVQETDILKLDEKSLAEAVAVICHRGPRFREVVAQHGLPSLRQSTGGLEGLLQIVTEQFLSLAAAKAIWSRVAERLKPFTAETVLACSPDELLGLGLSKAKAQSFHAIAGLVRSRDFVPEHLASLPDAAAQRKLVALPGVGPWTADIYLLSVLLRADVWPWGDVALQIAATDIFELPTRPDKAEMIRIGAGYHPYRAVLARLLWSHYRGLKKLKQA
jgi:DNA-3-methyladenine glycosylase II